MKNHLFLLFHFICFGAFSAISKYPETPDIVLLSKTPNQKLLKGMSEVKFKINGIEDFVFKKPIIYSIDEFIDTTWLKRSLELEMPLSAGKHDFKFYYSEKYREIITRKMTFESGYTYVYQLNFKDRTRNTKVRKPVIYLYPDTTLEVNVKIHPQGDLIFSYPIYPADGWTVTAQSNGDLLVDGRELNYLFWESEQANEDFIMHNATMVEKHKILDYLETSLTQVGMTSVERADMITYWAPIMLQYDVCKIKFLVNEECDAFSTLTVSPQPDNINRIFILFTGFHQVTESVHNCIPQVLTPFHRGGFTVVEWGGVELNKD